MLQGVSFEILLFQMALPLKWFNFDSMFQSKNVFERRQIFLNCQTFVYIFQLFVYNLSNKLAPLKRILALPTKDQIRTVFLLQPLEI